MNYVSTIDILSKTDDKVVSGEHDVIVTHDNENYVIEFYIKHGRKIQMHRAHVGTDKVFNKASFVWVEDNKVAIRLFNENSTDEFELKVWGEKRSTGMEVDTDETSKL